MLISNAKMYGRGWGREKKFHQIIASGNNLNSDFTIFTFLMLILTRYYILRFKSTEKYCCMIAFGELHTISLYYTTYMKHTRIGRATMNFPTFCVYSVHRSQLVLPC